MWINGKKIKIEEIVQEKGLIVEYKNVPVKNGLGDETIWKCTFEDGTTSEIEFMPNEFKVIISNVKN